MKRIYGYAVAYFALLGILLLLTGQWLFIVKIGITPDAIATYYLGSTEQFTQPKSVHGLLETAVPHFGGIGLFILASGHFLLFTPLRSKRALPWLFTLMFLAAFMNVASPFAIIAGFEWFAYIKLVAFLVFQIMAVILLWAIFNAAYFGFESDDYEVTGPDDKVCLCNTGCRHESYMMQ
jgi:hypothetical protein